MPTLKKGTRVRVNKDIFRQSSDYYEIRARFMDNNCGNSFGCDICYDKFRKSKRGYVQYAKANDTGVILETFKPKPDENFSKKKTSWSAKVIMDDGSGCKTFRLTSLELNDA